MSTVSIIIPCYNAVSTMVETIKSALAQDYPHVEIILVDDGSTDGTLALAQQFEPSVRVISSENRGVSAARNLGLRNSSGAIIVFLDSDDVLMPGTIQQSIEVMDQMGADVVICDWLELRLIDGVWRDDKRKSISASRLLADPQVATATDVWAPPAAIVYTKKIVDRIGPFRTDLPIIQDARFLFDAAYHGARFAHSPHLGAKYRIASNSLSRRNPDRFWLDIYANVQQIERLWTNGRDLSGAQHDALLYVYKNSVLGLYKAKRAEFSEALKHYNRLKGRPRGRATDMIWLWSTTAWRQRPSIRSWLAK